MGVQDSKIKRLFDDVEQYCELLEKEHLLRLTLHVFEEDADPRFGGLSVLHAW